MTFPSPSSDRALNIYLALAQYPILKTNIRARMCSELYKRGVITPQAFENEIREQAIRSQAREGLHNPFSEESAEAWEIRRTRIREYLIDFYFAYNLPYELFEQIVSDVLKERGTRATDLLISFNPELAPQDMLFEHALTIENMPPDEREQVEARLQELKVVLIRRMISDQLAYVNIAREWLKIADLQEIKRRKIGGGKIGGKAAGMLLAFRILNEVADDDIRTHLHIPESFFLGSDVMYTFMALNNLFHWNDQKYKTEEQIRIDYPRVQIEYTLGEFPVDILEELRRLLDHFQKQPLIVRSSSLLEDNFGTSFAGKYDSFFCPNQGTPAQNLAALTNAIIRIYASVVNPDALLYRRAKGLQDYDERMAILIQGVQGESMGRYYLPHAAGVAFSRNMYRWSPIIRREDGFMRLVWGLGTRAVDRVGNDYPRLVALSHPLLRPEASVNTIRHYSQQYVDVIDMHENAFKTLPVMETLPPNYPVLRYLAQVDQGEYLVPIRSMLMDEKNNQLILTFDELLRRTPLAGRMQRMVKLLETHYHAPVDTEFTIKITEPVSLHPGVDITLLQCRPQSHLKDNETRMNENIQPQDIIFSTHRMVPEGKVEDIHYVVFVDPEKYYTLPTEIERMEVGRAISRLNNALAGKVFICIGPGRWGTRNLDLGVFIGYSDIYNARALVELTGQGIGLAPEPSFGTHFFQDLVEANIYPLAIYLDDSDVIFNREFFYNTPDQIRDLLPSNIHIPGCLHLIKVDSFRPGHTITLIMDDVQCRAVAFLTPDQ